ncbi:MAG TPA: hypothetical protein VGF18_01510, partial [Candidatus Tumulicola sp.]
MKYLLFAVSIAGTLLTASPALSQTTAAPGSASMMAQPAAGMPALRHLVYQFGYNTKAAKQGAGTGTTTIDVVGMASDGGLTVSATDNWWNTVNPRQSYTCELYPSGSVTCAQRPNALSPIQATILPLLGRNFFKALAGGSHATWQQTFAIKATFAPAASSGFAGQMYTWNATFALTGKGTVSNDGQPVVLVQSTGPMKQQGGRYVTANQKSSILFDPRLKIPVFLDEGITFVPRQTTNRYTVEMKLI